jgi:hypothetical protein
MRFFRMRRVWVSAFLLLAVGIAARFAFAAPPPPPDFWEFTISNTDAGRITDIEVECFHAQGPDYYDEAPTPYKLSVPELEEGSEVILTLKKIYCINRITVTAQRNDRPLLNTLEIIADKLQFTGDPTPEWSGFCYGAPSGQTSYKPRLDFRMQGTPAEPMAKLHARCRWGLHYPQPAVSQSGFQP